MRSVVVIFIMAFLAAEAASAKHSITMPPDATITTVISAEQYNRLFIQGERIQAVRGVQGEYDLEKDELNGEVYLKAKTEIGTPISIFITTEKARHYHLLLVPEEQADPVIELIPKVMQPVVESKKDREPTQVLIDFVLAGLQENQDSSLTVKAIEAPTEHYIREDLVLVPQHQIVNSTYQGLLYQVTNRSDKLLSLRGDDFHSDGVIAVGLQNSLLQPKASTFVLVVSTTQLQGIKA